jgi:ELWxxDGT repeat protein
VAQRRHRGRHASVGGPADERPAAGPDRHRGPLLLLRRRPRRTRGALATLGSDGTPEGTRPLFAELGPLDLDRGDDERPFAALDGRVYFIAAEGDGPFAVWSTDGTPAGTALVRDIAGGPVDSFPRGLVAWRGRLWLAARDRSTGMELWTSDGTAAGTVRVHDIAEGGAWSFPQQLTATRDALYFSAQDQAHGRELWRLAAGDVP